MKLRIMSDLHSEFATYEVPQSEDDHSQTLILAGDIFPVTNTYDDLIISFFEDVCERFKYVLYVCGNHEFYRTRIDKAIRRLNEISFDFDNLFILDNELVELDGVNFIGSTLWTDMDNHDQYTIHQASLWMNDYRQITYHKNSTFRKLNPLDTIDIHIASCNFIFNELKSLGTNEKTVVITHHAPSPRSIGVKFADDGLNGAYMSNLEDDIIKYKPNLWIHGHMHESFDYVIGDTRIITNPRGYKTSGTTENLNFNGNMVIDI